jgi:hypothetical protein
MVIPSEIITVYLISLEAKLVHGEAVIRRELGTVIFVVYQRQWHDDLM